MHDGLLEHASLAPDFAEIEFMMDCPASLLVNDFAEINVELLSMLV